MKLRLNLLKGLLGIFMLLLAGLVAIAPIAGAGAVGDSKSPLTEQVRHELAMLPWYGVFDNLQYEVNGTEVVLSGQVISDHSQTKYDAEKAVERISGVTHVVDNIEVLPPSQFDDQIRRAEYRAIFSKADLGRYTMGTIPAVHIVVANGHVSLEGTVMNQMDRNIAGIAANSVSDVFSVTNNLQVGS